MFEVIRYEQRFGRYEYIRVSIQDSPEEGSPRAPTTRNKNRTRCTIHTGANALTALE
jgi:hypothetical protein